MPWRKRIPEIIICGIALAVLCYGFVQWFSTTWLNQPLHFVAALLSVGLFAAAGIRFVPVWMDFWRHPETEVRKPYIPRGTLLWVSGMFLLALVVRVCIISAARILSGADSSIFSALRMGDGLDVKHYLDIAQHGYHPSENGEALNLVFFPGYSALVGMLNLAVNHAQLSGNLVSWSAFVVSGPVLYKLLRLDFDHVRTMRILLIFLLFPAAIFYAYPMSEALFLLLAALCLYGVRTKQWLLAGVCGAYAAFTRSAGALLLAPMAIELIGQIIADDGRREHGKLWLKRGACLLLVPMGFAAYLYINQAVMGDPFIFMQYQKSNWFQSMTWFFATAANQADYAAHALVHAPDEFIGEWLFNLGIGYGTLLLLTLRGNRLRPSLTAWMLVHFAFSYGASWLLSGPRYMVVCFPLAVAAESLSERKWIMPVLLGASAVLYAVAFGLDWNIW